MAGNQMMLSIAAMIFLSMLILNVHSSTTDKLIILYSNEAVIEATGIVQAVFEEIQTKAFDENTVSDAAKERNLLTPVLSLGKDSSEVVYTDFDDIDDYNGLSITDSANVMGKFNLAVLVYYVDETSPYDSSGTRTYIKRVDISISNESLPTTLSFKKLISY
jgi:hypothetical protein